MEGVDRVRHGAPAGQPGARAGLLCAARGQPHAVGQPPDDGATVRVPVLRRLLDQRGGVVAGRGRGGVERSRGGERGDQAVRDVSGGLGSFFLAPHPGPLPWRGEGIRSFSPLTLALSPVGRGDTFFLAPPPGPLPWRGRGYVLSGPPPRPPPPWGGGRSAFWPPPPAPPPGGGGGDRCGREGQPSAHPVATYSLK